MAMLPEPQGEISPAQMINLVAPGETLEAVLKAARIADPHHTGPDGRQYLALPVGFMMHELADKLDLGQWPRQRVTVDDRASLSNYANRFSDRRSIIVADYDALTISARLDWHHDNQDPNPGKPGPDAHSVTLKLRPSEEFVRWNAFVREGFVDQETLARFLEENSADVLRPDPATLIEISRDFEATVGQTYKSSTRLDNGDRRIVFQNESRATNDVTVPQKITLQIPFYNGEAPDDIDAHFRWRGTPGGAVMFALEWHRVEYHRRTHFNAIAMMAAEETGLPVFLGRQGDKH